MSELYSISTFAHPAIVQSIREKCTSNSEFRLSLTCRKSVDLLHSISKVIALILNFPVLTAHDENFESNSFISCRVRKNVLIRMQIVRKLHHAPDQNPSTTVIYVGNRQFSSYSTKDRKVAFAAIKTVDELNFHRIWKFLNTLLLMIDKANNIGELILEKVM